MTIDDLKNAIVRLTIENFTYRDMIIALEQKVKELEKDATEDT